MGSAAALPPRRLHAVYTLCGCRRVALNAFCEALDAVLSASTVEMPAYLRLAPGCQREWGGLDAALSAGTMELQRLEWSVASYPLEPVMNLSRMSRNAAGIADVSTSCMQSGQSDRQASGRSAAILGRSPAQSTVAYLATCMHAERYCTTWCFLSVRICFLQHTCRRIPYIVTRMGGRVAIMSDAQL